MQAMSTFADFAIFIFCILFAELGWQRGENDFPANLSVYLEAFVKANSVTTSLRKRRPLLNLPHPHCLPGPPGYSALRCGEAEARSEGCED